MDGLVEALSHFICCDRKHLRTKI